MIETGLRIKIWLVSCWKEKWPMFRSVLYVVFILHICSVLSLVSTGAHAAFVITVDGPASLNDKRQVYEKKLIELALKKTKRKYGDYKIEVKPKLTHNRVLQLMKENTVKNYFRSFGYNPELERSQLEPIYYPIYRGTIGFRVCFLSRKIKDRFAKANTVEDIKRFTHTQGTGWFDVDILEFNGFKVHQNPSYDSLFLMVGQNRVDLFCRGANEVKAEYEDHKNDKDLVLDQTKSFYYPFPNFFYVNKKNELAASRIAEGLEVAIKDGSIDVLWQKYIAESVDFIEIEKRKIFILQNPMLNKETFDVKKYYYKPFYNALKGENAVKIQ